MSPDTPIRLLRHALATLAYRAAKVLRDFPEPAATTRIGAGARSPLELVTHLGDLMRWGSGMARGDRRWEAAPLATFGEATARFFANLAAFDAALVEEPAGGRTSESLDQLEQLIQGPIADALTHVGQLALLRGIAGAPVRPESYARAEIVVGRVGFEQAPPRAEFDGDASAHARDVPRGTK